MLQRRNKHTIKDIWKKYVLEVLSQNHTFVCGKRKSDAYYYLYRKERGDNGLITLTEVMNYKTFRDIITEFFMLGKEAVIQGYCLDFIGRLGKLCAWRVERNHNIRRLDFKSTQSSETIWDEKTQSYIKKMVFFTDDDWVKIGWHKYKYLKNRNLYKFNITKNNLKNRGQSFNNALTIALKENPDLKYKYLFFPLKKNKPKKDVI